MSSMCSLRMRIPLAVSLYSRLSRNARALRLLQFMPRPQFSCVVVRDQNHAVFRFISVDALQVSADEACERLRKRATLILPDYAAPRLMRNLSGRSNADSFRSSILDRPRGAAKRCKKA
jgi:hypothetical protein